MERAEAHHRREEKEAIFQLGGFSDGEQEEVREGGENGASGGASGPPSDQTKMIMWIMKTKKKWVVSATTASFILLLFFSGTFLYSQPFDLASLLPASYNRMTTFQAINHPPLDYPQIPAHSLNSPPPDYSHILAPPLTPPPSDYPHIAAHPFTCIANPNPDPTATKANMTITCPANYPPSKPSPTQENPPPTCPDYFRWIHEDLKPWNKNKITREMLAQIEVQGNHFRSFRLVIVNGTAYVKQYIGCYQTRDVFTIWGILQLLKMYPGRVPDLDLIFQCNDVPSVNKTVYPVENALPVFHYCGSEDSYDIVFPDWSFWGWPEINIKPWVPLKKDLEQGNKIMNWTDREPFAFWKGNTFMGDRKVLNTCNSRKKWNTIIQNQDWGKEIRRGFKNSDMSKQCIHRYKIYMEGIAWSVSEKYILACDSMSLLVNPKYYEFFTRSLIPLKHYWPIDPTKICESVKFAVDWGNRNPEKAQEIGREGTRFVEEQILMHNVYDYMFHLLSEYSKLLAYTPTVPEGAVELCSERWVCPNTGDMERKYKMETLVESDGGGEPCRLPPPFEERELRDMRRKKEGNIRKVDQWMKKGILMGG